MTRLVQQLKALCRRLVKGPRDRVLAKLRAHMALAVNSDLRDLVLHVTAERVTLTAQVTAELAPVRRQLDDLNLCNDALLREVVRLQREVRQLSDAMGRPSPQNSPVSSPFGDTPHLKLADQRQARAA